MWRCATLRYALIHVSCSVFRMGFSRSCTQHVQSLAECKHLGPFAAEARLFSRPPRTPRPRPHVRLASASPLQLLLHVSVEGAPSGLDGCSIQHRQGTHKESCSPTSQGPESQ